MNTGSPKDEPNGQRTPVRATMGTTAPVREIGNQHDWQLWLRIRRTIADLFAVEAKRSPDCSDGESKTGLTVTQEIYVLSSRRSHCGAHRRPLAIRFIFGTSSIHFTSLHVSELRRDSRRQMLA